MYCTVLNFTVFFKGITDSQLKEDSLASSFGGLKVHVFTQEAYGTDRSQHEYFDLEKVIEDMESGISDDDDLIDGEEDVSANNGK